MKKVMIAADLAAMVGGAFADLCDDTINSDCGAWKVNFTLKTLVPKRTVCKSGGCADCSDSSKECVFYYEQGTRKIQGYIWGCDSNCFEDGSDYFYTLWEPAFKFAWAPLNRVNITNAAGQVTSYQYDANPFDGAFLRYIVSQPLPGGAKGFALMINGGKAKPGFEGLFRCVEQKTVLGQP